MAVNPECANCLSPLTEENVAVAFDAWRYRSLSSPLPDGARSYFAGKKPGESGPARAHDQWIYIPTSGCTSCQIESVKASAELFLAHDDPEAAYEELATIYAPKSVAA